MSEINKGAMNMKHRKNIVREANKLMRAEHKNYDSLSDAQKIGIQSEFIEKVCKSKGWDICNFYAVDGETLDKLLG